MMGKKGFIENIIQHPKIIFIVVGILVLVGIFGVGKINKQEFPEFSMPQGLVVAVYPGASSEEMEEQVTKPLEQYLFSYDEAIASTSSSYTKEGIAYIYLSTNTTAKTEKLFWSRVRHGLADFKRNLPAGCLGVVVLDDFGHTSSLLISMESEHKTYRDLSRYMDYLKMRLRQIPEASNINSFGEQGEELDIFIDREKLATYGMSSSTVMASLFAQGFTSLGGTMQTGDNLLPLHVSSPLTSEQELGEHVVLYTPSGSTLRLKDVALIQRRYSEPTTYITKDGKQALVLSVEMRSNNNIVEFGKDVDKVLEDFQKVVPDDVNLYRITDLPKVVDESIWSFMLDLIIAMLVVIATMLLLFPLRSALIPTIEIPIVTAISIAIMYLIGFELNIVTLAALITTLGMMVDDSIVMVDGYMEFLKRGESPLEAAVLGVKTFFPSLAAATLTICCIFMPYLFTMDGVLGDFVSFFPTSISIALATSLIFAMLVTPWLEQHYIKPERVESNIQSRWSEKQNRFFLWLQSNYERCLRWYFDRPIRAILFAMGGVAVALMCFMLIPIQLMPKAERDSMAVEITLPEGATLDETGRVCRQVEDYLQKDQDIVSITTFVGSGSPRFMAAYSPHLPGSNYAQMIVNTTGNKATERVIKRYQTELIDKYPNASVFIKQLSYQYVKNPIEVRLFSDDIALAKRYADTVKTHFGQHEDKLLRISDDWGQPRPCIRIRLKTEEASRLGITKAMLSANLGTLFGGVPVTSVWEEGQELKVRLFAANDPTSHLAPGTCYRQSSDFEDLKDAMVPTAVPGLWVPLRQVADIEPDWQESTIAHQAGRPCVTVGAELKYGLSQPKVERELKRWLDHDFKNSLPEGVTMQYGGLDSVNANTMPGILKGILISLFIIFFFLLFHFKKIRLMLLSLIGILFCMPGAMLGLLIFGCDLSVTAIIGIVSLMGINVRNTIVMFDYAEQLRASGMSIRQVAIEAGHRRMRPIFLTSMTTAVGVLPMIIHATSLWQPMGVVITFGSISAILFTVLVMPVAYWAVYAVENKKPWATTFSKNSENNG